MTENIMQYLRLSPLKQGGTWCIWWKGAGAHIHSAVGKVVFFDEAIRKIKIIQSIPGVFEKGLIIDFDSIVQLKQIHSSTTGTV